jgi:4-amino-4-deoxy-L-arabinose transferase-like glycosyltransferase
VACLGIWLGLDELGAAARIALVVFILALIAWSLLRLPETPVALAAALALVGFGVSPRGGCTRASAMT